MDLDQFIAEMHARLDQFAADWRRHSRANPVDWPAHMDFPEWWEQFEVSDQVS